MPSSGTMLRNLAIMLLVIVVSFGAYYFVYLQQHDREITQDHLRLLLNSGNTASDVLEGLLGNVTYAVAIDSIDIARTASGAARGHRESHRDSLDRIRKAIETRLGLISQLTLRLNNEIGLRDSVAGFLRKPTVGKLVKRIRKSKELPIVRIAVALDGQGDDLQLVFASEREFRANHPELVMAAQANLRDLIAPELPVQAFEGIVLARSNGDVLFEAGDSPLRLRRLVFPAPPPKAPNQERLPGSQVFDLKLAGESYRFFVQPVSLPILINRAPSSSKEDSCSSPPCWQPEDYWYVAGFIPTARYRVTNMAISPTTVLVVVGLIVLGLFCLPILKVRYLGAREELRQADVIMLAIAIVLGASLVTYSTFFIWLHEEQLDSTTHSLRYLSGDITRNLRNEMARLDSALVSATVEGDSSRLGAFRDSILARERFTTFGPIARSGGPLSDAIRIYPFFEMFIWMDSTGWQNAKWSIRKSITPVSTAGDRPYFQLAERGLPWAAADSCVPYDDGRVIESIRSKATSQEFAMLSRRLRNHDGHRAVGVIESRLLSVMSAVLPPGEGFAVVDHAGQVLFHSDQRRNLRENLFQELGSDLAVRSAVEAGQVAECKTTYHTAPAELRVTPIAGTPWSLIVLADQTGERTMALDVLTIALALYGLHLIALLLFATVAFIWLASRKRPGEVRRLWYWPDARRGKRYAVLCLSFAFLGVVAVGLILYTKVEVTLVVSLGVALVAFTLFHVGMRTGQTRAADQGANAYWKQWYTAMMVLLALLLGVVPTLGYWRAAYNDGAIANLKVQQLAFAEAMNARHLDMLDWYHDVPMRRDARQAIAANLRPNSSGSGALGFYTPRHWRWQYEDATIQKPGSHRRRCRRLIVELIRGLLSIHGFPSASIGPTTSDDVSFGWYQDRDDTLTCYATRSMAVGTLGILGRRSRGGAGFHTLWIGSRTPSFSLWKEPVLWIAPILLLLLYFALRIAIRYTFLEDVGLPKSIDGETELEKHPEIQRAILLRFHLKEKLRTDRHVIGIREVRAAPGATYLVSQFEKSGKHGVLLIQFDHGLREPAIIERKLALLEGLGALPSKPSVYIQSAVEPLYFLVSRFNDHFAERAKLGISLDRWASVLQDYVRVRVGMPDPRGPAPTHDELKGIVALNEECAPNEFLRKQKAHVAALAEVQDMSWDDVVATVLDNFQAYYRRMWTSCSSEEKLLLYRIAKEGFANRNAAATLLPLLRRGLVVMDPNCRIMNESFRRFILVAERPEVFAKWQQRGGDSAWSRMKTPILLSVAVLGVFFFTTQREALNQSLGLLAAVAASAPSVLNLIGSVAKLSQPPAKE